MVLLRNDDLLGPVGRLNTQQWEKGILFLFLNETRAHDVDPYINFHFCCCGYLNVSPLNNHQGCWAEAGWHGRKGYLVYLIFESFLCSGCPLVINDTEQIYPLLLCLFWESYPLLLPLNSLSPWIFFFPIIWFLSQTVICCLWISIDSYLFAYFHLGKVNNYIYFSNLGQWEDILSPLSFRDISD